MTSNLYTARQPVFLGAVTVSGTTALEANTNDVSPSPFIVKRVVARVTTGVTAAAAAMTLTWRPTPGSATGAITIGTFSIPVAAANALFAWDMIVEGGSTTTIGAASDTSGYGMGGSSRYEAEDFATKIVGPGGGFHLVSDGASSAGVCDFWVEALTLPFSGSYVSDVTQLAATI